MCWCLCAAECCQHRTHIRLHHRLPHLNRRHALHTRVRRAVRVLPHALHCADGRMHPCTLSVHSPNGGHGSLQTTNTTIVTVTIAVAHGQQPLVARARQRTAVQQALVSDAVLCEALGEVQSSTVEAQLQELRSYARGCVNLLRECCDRHLWSVDSVEVLMSFDINENVHPNLCFVGSVGLILNCPAAWRFTNDSVMFVCY